MFEFFKKVKGEMTHVLWPTRKQATWLTVFVVAISLLVAYFLGLFDIIFTGVLGRIL